MTPASPATSMTKATPGQCIVCRRRSLRGLKPMVDSEGNEASIHTYHRMMTIFRAGFSISVLGKDEPVTPGAWTFR